MRPEPNNEIDLLLRELARRDGAPVSEFQEQHLDADELNSYVANATPAAARARYTEHLADCSSCRKLIAQLSATQGPVAVPQSTPVVAPSGLKNFLANLFSPMVLRYAVPALGLIVIAVVGIFVLRQDQRSADVARVVDVPQNQPSIQPPATSEAPVEAEPNKRAAARPYVSQPAAPAAESKDGPAPVANQPADKVTTAEPPPPAPKAAPVEEQARKEKKTETAQPASAADAEKQRADDAAKNEARKRDQVEATAGVAVASAPAARRAESRPAKSSGAGTSTGSGSSETRDSGRARDETQNAFLFSDARSVAGRQFRKSGSVWIDTAYKSSSAVTHVARGSEQYRALVADEPSIRTIAEELEGQIIVVWKGRTYRIR